MNLEGLGLAVDWSQPSGVVPLSGWPTVAAFHGLTLDKSFFKDLSAPLNNKGIALLAVDFPGHGDSPGNLWDTTLQSQAGIVKKVAAWMAQTDRIDQKNIGFIAFSMSAVSLLEALEINCPLALWAPLLNTVEWSNRRLGDFERCDLGKSVRIWGGKKVCAALFDDAPGIDPGRRAENWPGPLFVAHSEKDRNQRPGESHRLVHRRQAMDKPVESWFPHGSGHLFNDPDERRELLHRTAVFFEKTLG